MVRNKSFLLRSEDKLFANPSKTHWKEWINAFELCRCDVKARKNGVFMNKSDITERMDFRTKQGVKKTKGKGYVYTGV